MLAAIFWTILQAVGGIYIDHTSHSSPATATFALVIGVLAWLHLGSQLTHVRDRAELRARHGSSGHAACSTISGGVLGTLRATGTPRELAAADEHSPPAAGQPPQTTALRRARDLEDAGTEAGAPGLELLLRDPGGRRLRS